MSLIIPWEDIHAGRFPTVRNFEATAQEVLSMVAANPRVFKGAAFWGSLVRGDLDLPRSDLDLIVVGVDGFMSTAQAMVREFTATAHARRVALDCHLLRASDAYFVHHDFGPSFRGTFDRCRSDYMVGVPLHRCFRFRPGSVQVEMLEKTARKLRSTRSRDAVFRLRHAHDVELIEQWLQLNWRNVVRPMRLHVSLGRSLLWWLRGSLEEDGKREVIEQFLGEVTFASLHGRYHHLVDLDHRYDDVLARAREGSLKRTGYLRKVAGLLRENFRTSIELLDHAIDFMRSKGRDQLAA